MSKTVPQMVKIDRADHERVEAHVEQYPWQKAPKASAAARDPYDIPTVKLSRAEADAHAQRAQRTPVTPKKKK